MIPELASALLMWALAFIQHNAVAMIALALIVLNYVVTQSWARKVRKQLGVLPEYVSWLESKAELYEGALWTPAAPQQERCSNSSLTSIRRNKERLLCLPHSRATARTSATAGPSTL
jgi:hypothetical protein